MASLNTKQGGSPVVFFATSAAAIVPKAGLVGRFDHRPHARQRMSLNLGLSASLQARCALRRLQKQDPAVVSARPSLPHNSAIGYIQQCMTAAGKSGSSRLLVSASRDDIRIAAPNVDLESLPEYLKKECLLFYYPDQEPLAKKVAEASSSIQLSEVKWA